MTIQAGNPDHLLLNDAELSDAWIRHKGGACPIPHLNRPLILPRDGTIFREPPTCGGKWQIFDEQSRWGWQGRAPDALNVIAYQMSE